MKLSVWKIVEYVFFNLFSEGLSNISCCGAILSLFLLVVVLVLVVIVINCQKQHVLLHVTNDTKPISLFYLSTISKYHTFILTAIRLSGFFCSITLLWSQRTFEPFVCA